MVSHPISECQPNDAANQELQMAIKQLDQMNMSDEARSFLLAELYIQYSRNTEALEQLEALVNAPSQVATVPERDDEVRCRLVEARLLFQSVTVKEVEPSNEVEQRNEIQQSSNVQERLKGLLEEVQALRAYNRCGACQTGSGPGYMQWNPPIWVCVGCGVG